MTRSSRQGAAEEVASSPQREREGSANPLARRGEVVSSATGIARRDEQRTLALDIDPETAIDLVRQSAGLQGLWLGSIVLGGRTWIGRGAFGSRTFEITCDVERRRTYGPLTTRRDRSDWATSPLPPSDTPEVGLLSSASKIRGELVDHPHGSRLILSSSTRPGPIARAAAVGSFGLAAIALALFAGGWSPAALVAGIVLVTSIVLVGRWSQVRRGQSVLAGLVLEALSQHVVGSDASPFRRSGGGGLPPARG